MTEYIDREATIAKLLSIKVTAEDFNYNFANGYNAGVINAVTEMRLAPAADVVERKKPVTNADRIRAMTDEDLALILTVPHPPWCSVHDMCPRPAIDFNCNFCAEDWLRQEVENEN